MTPNTGDPLATPSHPVVRSPMARTTIEFDDREFLYLQLAEIIRGLIAEGERGEGKGFPPGKRIPSKAELRREHGVSARTVDTAMDILKAEKLIETRVGKGYYVIPPEERGRKHPLRRATDRPI
jgi:DNA-binding GntR family transcriptional regulator